METWNTCLVCGCQLLVDESFICDNCVEQLDPPDDLFPDVPMGVSGRSIKSVLLPAIARHAVPTIAKRAKAPSK
jgi:hypothetical protein